MNHHTTAPQRKLPDTKELLGSAVDSNSRDKDDDRRLLSYAAENGRENEVKILLEQPGVAPDSRDENGRTPLSYAAGKGHENVAELLLARYDVDPDYKDEGLLSGWEVRYACGRRRYFVDRNGRMTTWEDPQKGYNRWTLLSWAAKEGHVEVVELLIRDGRVYANFKDKFGQTPLWLAVKNERDEVMKLLLTHSSVNTDSANV
jgi:ankyrin repeat protein